jgi:hypothetical protein
MSGNKRNFSRELLEEWGLPLKNREIILHDEPWDELRWCIVHRLIFRAPDDGKTYEVYWERPATEMQEGLDPWNDEKAVMGTHVEQVEVVDLQWRPVQRQTTARGLTPKEAMLRLLATTSPDPDKKATYSNAAEKARTNEILRLAAEAIATHPGPHKDEHHPDASGFWWDTRDRDAAATIVRDLMHDQKG